MVVGRIKSIVFYVCVASAASSPRTPFGKCQLLPVNGRNTVTCSDDGDSDSDAVECRLQDILKKARLCDRGTPLGRLRAARVHRVQYGKFRPSHARLPLDPLADDDDDDDDDDSDLLVPPYFRRNPTVDPPQQATDSMLAGGQAAVLALVRASACPWRATRPDTHSLTSLHIRLQI